MLATAMHIHEKGLRENNEDACFYDITPNGINYYIVCDGVGGMEKGEVASKLTCKIISDYIRVNPLVHPFDIYVKNLIENIDIEFDRYIISNPETKGMATTLVLLLLLKDQAVIAHIGDSRLYHIRNNQILFHTYDHSFVNDLVKKGIITEEESTNHPLKNVITRAIQGITTKPVKADIHVTSDIHSSDYFFLCTDGILESVDSNELVEILEAPDTNDLKMEKIRSACKIKSKDNYTAILVQVN
jgi:protein phosphatase